MPAPPSVSYVTNTPGNSAPSRSDYWTATA